MTYLSFYGAILLYVVFSSATPDSIGIAEYAIALLLLLSIGMLRGLNNVTAVYHSQTLNFHRFFLLYMLTIPLMLGIIHTNSLSDVIRDLIPLLFLILPLCFYRNYLPRIEYLLMIAGGILALRYLMPFLGTSLIEFKPLLYLANSPLIPFAAIMGFGLIFSDRRRHKAFLLPLLGLSISLICFTAMALTLQRAPMGLCALACLIIFSIKMPEKPITTLFLCGGLILLTLYFWPFILEITNGLTDKNMTVGFNNRVTEFQAVLSRATLFGEGWGAIWPSPAVGDIEVRYTHNMVSYYILKAGLIGGAISIGFITFWFYQIIRLLRQDITMALAIAIPFIIHISLYAGFKSLDFALILTLLMTLSCHHKLPRKSPSSIASSRQPLAQQVV
jgi:hypothetical protein